MKKRSEAKKEQGREVALLFVIISHIIQSYIAIHKFE